MSVDWILDTPANKRWWLPDRIHSVGSNIFGNEIRMDVTNQFTGECRQSVVFDFDKNPNWQDLCQMFGDLAKKKYPRSADVLSHRHRVFRRQRFAL